ncbi:uncharacterized protein RHOBADRAFT_54817 [Rhodotorula graminis WP1]|uniref:Uncharacterized protein n=1 Tax=Rhodotorula graminis (strain WP1) TaxID=578459 RepID=A0A0P9EWG2_RHOGW|nr:uncharacterized protein RHOBADRAFT_54817 [Rhodotorula graminis WP1]KPV73618.1 hypothetical protein RHOBADRAFT_54817 [Rhodotorula graminis WP1]
MSHRWQRPKALPVGQTTSLSLEQQQILAAVPRWKKAWVRPSTLKPGQNPNYKVYKWVLDAEMGESKGTEEEMQAALQEVAAGNVPLPSAGGPAAVDASGPASLAPSGTATPAPGAAPVHPPQQVSAAALQASSNPLAQVQHADPAKPPAGPAPSGAAPSVQEAVKGLGEVKMGAGIDAVEVKREERSLVKEDQA